MQLRDDFSKHISELNNPLERPYSRDIDTSLLKNIDDINHLNKEIQNINPDYMTFLPAYFWVLYFAIGWIYFSSFMFLIISTDGLLNLQVYNIPLLVLDIFIALFIFTVFCIPLILLLYQFIRKYPYRTQYYFLKKEQKIAYYYRPLMKFRQPYELKIVDYKDVHPDLHLDRYNQAYTPLNLYVADPKTGDITHHLKLEDYRVDPRVQWAFIRTYMERPAEDLPIDNKICQAYPADTSKSLFACSDIVFRKNGMLNNIHSGRDTAIVLTISSLYALGYLFQGNHYQCVKRAILHPDVKKLLTWDGKNNPYPIQPVTLEAEQAFQGKRWDVNTRWIVAILINISLFALAVMAYNG